MRPEKTTIVEDLSAKLNQSPFLDCDGIHRDERAPIFRSCGSVWPEPAPSAEWLRTLSCVEPRQKWVILIWPTASLDRPPL